MNCIELSSLPKGASVYVSYPIDDKAGDAASIRREAEIAVQSYRIEHPELRFAAPHLWLEGYLDYSQTQYWEKAELIARNVLLQSSAVVFVGDKLTPTMQFDLGLATRFNKNVVRDPWRGCWNEVLKALINR